MSFRGGDRDVVVVGGGLAGLMAALEVAERGHRAFIISLVPARRSHSVTAQGGLNAGTGGPGESDSPEKHFEDIVSGGDFLANQKMVRGMCEKAPSIVNLLDRMGVPFDRTDEGRLAFRRSAGNNVRAATAGFTTGKQILFALDEQVRRRESEGRILRFEHHDFLGLIRDRKGNVRGVTVIDLRDSTVAAFRGGAVILATGGPGLVFGKSLGSIINNGAAASRVYQEGARYANGEFIQVQPTALPGEDKFHMITELVRKEGARVWVPRDGKEWYFLEEWYPDQGNLVSRDLASRAIFKVIHELGLGVDGKPQVNLDATHLDEKVFDKKLIGVSEICGKFAGLDPRKSPIPVAK